MLCEKAKEKGLISSSEYYDRINYLKNFLEEIDANLPMEEIDDILYNQSEAIENEYGR